MTMPPLLFLSRALFCLRRKIAISQAGLRASVSGALHLTAALLLFSSASAQEAVVVPGATMPFQWVQINRPWEIGVGSNITTNPPVPAGSTATPTVTITIACLPNVTVWVNQSVKVCEGAPPVSTKTLTLAWQGKIRDRVGQTPTSLGSDGNADGVVSVTVQGGSGTITDLFMQSSEHPGYWKLGIPPYWILGVASTLDGPLLNDPTTMKVSLAVQAGDSFLCFMGDSVNYGLPNFDSGATLALVATFSDGSTATGTVTIP